MSKNYLINEGETPKEFAERLQKLLDNYKEKVSTLKSAEDLENEEKACIADLDKYEDYIKNTTYKLPEEVTYDGTHYTKKEITNNIVYFLNKMEVKWDFTLGLYELSKLWRNSVEEINFHQMDSTLRTLDQVQFKGFKEWKDILAINEYFKANNDQFSVDTAGFIYLHQRHNAVLEQQDLIKPVGEVTEPVEENPAESKTKEKAKRK